ncbi:T9SS type A sorting domain-containing protein [uncultured Draconibacterium sp.]|uniref:T9SS type A sorting domain-containing protein n=1 Tax=uncultured Draconibacterium sp. TaxID=1573823 RepID=UPI002AA7F33A|nr:T9SS type A sorting domain-containing protein [uncultured Draconibacterium sp.]
MKKLLLFLIIIVNGTFLPTLNAQEIVSTAGTVYETNGIQLSWTLGETVIETAESGSLVLTQGFHQSKLVITALDDITIADFEVKVYPNPTSDFVVVHFDENNLNTHIQLFDLAGKKLKESVANNTDTQMNMTEYPGGTYLLKLLDDNFHPIQTFKIIKR